MDAGSNDYKFTHDFPLWNSAREGMDAVGWKGKLGAPGVMRRGAE